ncbi:hypothetical protein SPRG_06414 [Saprolegnia parasitica CBS 223.65]|uniref:Uncharacterized protein n=1 Tax=Saprolegnia parasitica (strain CBS 223.65) TaxID=695850 RepID=A0A067CPT4_SAPPC|nr:hypothetical protein SPRG_06414 [Saprolegnia parasitica CBS 223.65]KDO28556.1 hypothetical protein SPRG_06414 [Saprolegnia parasitica CBS 223.65]|eukprot:XP_012200621.1 hypothetical protein SPRG_06414 [Saprolegnia parasitica CBS 223.65]
MTSFQHVVLGQPEIASIVFGYQYGVYEDVRHVFCACNELVMFDTWFIGYQCDESFFTTAVPTATTRRDSNKMFYASSYFLSEHEPDARLPLHIAIAEGCVDVTKRILGCRPDLASEDTIVLAFLKDRLEIAKYLLKQRALVPELTRRINGARRPGMSSKLLLAFVMNAGTLMPQVNVGARDDRASYMPEGFLARILQKASTESLELLVRFGLSPDDFSVKDTKAAIEAATCETATLALKVFPWLTYSGILDDVAGKGFLPLVRSLHERGLECSRDAMDNAAANGHLEVVRFLHFNRTEGCTTKALDEAIRNGHLAIVRFLIEHRSEGASRNMLDCAAANGHLEVVQYLHSLGSSIGCTVYTVDVAVSRGHLNVVQFLLTNRSEGGSRDEVVAVALRKGHLQTAEYLLSLGYPFPTLMGRWSKCAFRNPKMVGVFKRFIGRDRRFKHDWLYKACIANNVPLVQLFFPHSNPRLHCQALRAAFWGKSWDVMRFLLANIPADNETFDQVLFSGNLAMAADILQRQPELRKRDHLHRAAQGHYFEAMRFLLAEGMGNPRKCLVEIAGNPKYVTASKLLLPHCMDATNHLDNVLFLLDLLALPDRRRATTRRLITSDLLDQGRKASQTIQLAPSVAVRASTLLEAGDVVDWALALVIGHLHATATTEELEKKTALVKDAELTTQLMRLVANTRKCSTCGDEIAS